MPETVEEREYRQLVEDIATLDEVSWEHYEVLMEVLIDQRSYDAQDVAVRAVNLSLANPRLATVVKGIADKESGLDLVEFNADVAERRGSIPSSALKPTLYTRATRLSPLSIPEPQG